MPKQVLQVTNFAGGLNAYADPRDIEDNQFVQIWNAVPDKNGIIRVSGMAADEILTEHMDNTNFQKGYGLFQFTADYSLSGIDGNFSTGIKTGTLSAYASGTPSVTLESGVAAQAADYYKDWIIYIYSGPGRGESRKITASSTASPPVFIISAATTATLTSASKYILYRWTPSSNFLGDGTNNYDYIDVSDGSYSLVSKSGTVTTNTSNDLGYVEYEPKLSLTPGVPYTVSFFCKTLSKYYNDVSDGEELGIVDTLINSNESEVSISTSGVTLTVDTTTATEALVKDKRIYKDDGTFIGTCTSVDSGTQIQLDKAEVAIPNDTDLYVSGGYADKVPWVELYSTTIADTRGSILTLSDYTPTSGESNLSGNWEADTTNVGVEQTSTSGTGTGASFNVIVTGTTHVVRLRPNALGTGYAIGDTIVIYDPDAGNNNYITLTVGTINTTGLSLVSAQGENGSYDWLKGIEGDGNESGYITNPDSNHIDNGDFRDGATSDGWGLVNHDDGSAHGLTAARADADHSYDGVANTSLKLTTTESGNNSGWISQTVTLQESTPYALNFLYSAIFPTMKGEVRILDPNSNQINEKTELPATGGSTTPVYRWATSVIAGIEGSTNSDFTYIQFKTPVSKTSAGTVACKVQFRPIVTVPSSSAAFYVHGVTLHKNHFDLSNMSFRNPEANNPFTNRVRGYSKYSFSFTLPGNYTSVSDWVFRIHAGKYGLNTGNDLSISATQEVNIKNIEIIGTFETKDVVTLMSDNGEIIPSISAYTSTSSSWIKDFLTFSGNKIKPTYDYINGMLKISDGNFLNTNSNKLVYYSKRRIPEKNIFPSWVKRSVSIPSPPALTVSQNDDGNDSSAVFNCGRYLNGIFEGHEFREAKSSNPTNWPMDCFGEISHSVENTEGVINPTGMVTRHWMPVVEGPKTKKRGRQWTSGTPDVGYNENSEITSTYQQLYHKDDNGWYFDNFLNEDITDADLDDEYYFGDDEDYTLPAENRLTNYNMIPSADLISSIHTVGPSTISKYFVIEPSAFSDLTSEDWESRPTPENPIGNIRYVDIKFRWEIVGWTGLHQSKDRPVLPAFDLKAGIINPDELQDGDLTDKQVSGNQIHFDTLNNNYRTSTIGDNIRLQSMNYGGEKSIYKICTSHSDVGGEGFLDRYDSRGKLKGAHFARGSAFSEEIEYYNNIQTEGTNMQIVMDIEDKIEFTVNDILKIDSENDTLLVELFEDSAHSGLVPYNSDVDGSLKAISFVGLMGHLEDGTSAGSIASQNRVELTPDGEGFEDEGGDNQIAIENGQHSSYYTRYVIERFNIGFFNKEIDTTIELGGNNIGINFSWGDTDSEGVGWADRLFEVATTSVNTFGEESALSESAGTLGESVFEGGSFILPGQAPSIRFKMKETYLNDIFLEKTKIYMRDTESEIWYLQCYVDHEKRTFHSTTSFNSADASAVDSEGNIEWSLERDNFKNFNEVSSYSSETMVSQNDGKDNNNLVARYKTSVVANNRLYVGNVMQNDKIYGDRMLKSPIGKYNILPASNFIDVATNDGDEITALAYYKDKILQFKNRKVFVINVSGDYEFLEDTLDNVGVLHQASVAKTPYGVVWANKTGCYLYDGQQMTNLIDGKIPVTSDYADITDNYWSASSVGNDPGDCVIGYIQDRDTILIKWSAKDTLANSGFPDAITYHFPTKSWCFNVKGIAGNAVAPYTGNLSNMITNIDGDILYCRFTTQQDVSGDSSSVGLFNSIKKWTNSALATGSILDKDGSSKIMQFSTKDFIFGDIINRKKLYKVYITYKVKTDGTDSGVSVTGAVNGSNDFDDVSFSTNSKFAGTTTDCYGSSTLDETDGVWKIAELKFASPSVVNNIYSFQLKLSGTAVVSDFEVNDISIVFKTKRTK